MQTIKQNGEKHLLRRIEDLRHRGIRGSVLHLHLSRLTTPRPATTQEMIERLVAAGSGDTEADLYCMSNHDLVLVLAAAPSSVADKIARDICFIFADDPLAHEPWTIRGNTLCTSYRSRDEWVDLHKWLIGLQLVHEDKKGKSAEIFALHPEVFAETRLMRHMRKRLRILVVEDQRFSRQLVLESLGKDYDIITAGDGVEAVTLYEKYAPDIVFLDIDLPEMSGLEALKHISDMDDEAFVVMLTASHARDDVQLALQRHAKGYVVKPFTKQKIHQYLKMFQEQYAKRGARAS